MSESVKVEVNEVSVPVRLGARKKRGTENYQPVLIIPPDELEMSKLFSTDSDKPSPLEVFLAVHKDIKTDTIQEGSGIRALNDMILGTLNTGSRKISEEVVTDFNPADPSDPDGVVDIDKYPTSLKAETEKRTRESAASVSAKLNELAEALIEAVGVFNSAETTEEKQVASVRMSQLTLEYQQLKRKQQRK